MLKVVYELVTCPIENVLQLTKNIDLIQTPFHIGNVLCFNLIPKTLLWCLFSNQVTFKLHTRLISFQFL